MAQKKKVSVKSAASKAKTAGARAKTATKAKVAARPASKKVAATKKAAAKPSVKAKASSSKTAKVATKKVPTTKAATLKTASTRKPPAKAATGKNTATKATVSAKKPAPAKKAAPARKTAGPEKRSADRVRKAVAAAAPATVKRAAVTPKPAAKPMTPKEVAAKAVEAKQQAGAAKKPSNARLGFKTNEYVVYPAHGVGRIVGIEEQEIAGMSLELFVITFDKDKMTLRVPTGKTDSVGMRKLSEGNVVEKAMTTLKGRARVKRTMWSRRAQEYEQKINSGDLVSIAEVVRDLYRSESQPEQSYSERQLYEAALDRMAREIAAVDKLDERGATQRITDVLSKSAKGRRQAEEEAEARAAETGGAAAA